MAAGARESLASFLGADRDRVACGVSIGIASSTERLLEQVDGYLAEGYQRIKLKIEPGTDVDRVAAVRGANPGILLSVDANAAYTLADVDTFLALDAFGLLMVEQPLHHEDLVRHAALQRQIATDLCLDESIRSEADARAAIELGACRIVNIKQGRVGGLLEAARVHDACRALGVPVWCGGMLETGVGRAANLALAALPGFTLPGDTSASAAVLHRGPHGATRRCARRHDGGASGAGDRGRAGARAPGGVHAGRRALRPAVTGSDPPRIIAPPARSFALGSRTGHAVRTMAGKGRRGA